jgi:hypothetical protein
MFGDIMTFVGYFSVLAKIEKNKDFFVNTLTCFYEHLESKSLIIYRNEKLFELKS